MIIYCQFYAINYYFLDHGLNYVLDCFKGIKVVVLFYMTKVFLGMLLIVRMLYHYGLIGKNKKGCCNILIETLLLISVLRLFHSGNKKGIQ